MRIAFFEDQNASDFGPLVLMRPVFELICGHFSLRERVMRRIPVTEWGVFVREFLTETYRESHTEAHVNDLFWLQEGPTVLINGRWLPDPQGLSNLQPDEVGVIDGTVAYLTIDPAEVPLASGGAIEEAIYQIARTRKRVEATGKLLARPWDLVDYNPTQIEHDFSSRVFDVSKIERTVQLALIGPPESIAVDRAAKLEPFVVIDATRGPVSIEAGAVIQSFTRIEGPCHIGHQAQLFRANVRGGVTIGPNCRVGGEIEASILHGYVNKYHGGFLGHSYVCPWVNLGAMTTNSDLKNDYSAVRVPLTGISVDSGKTKVGTYIGDHTKTGLGALFNTGSSIGVMCMVLPTGELLPRFVPSFSNVWNGALSEGLPLERSLAAARIVMERRNCEFTDAQQRLLRWLHSQTHSQREQAILRFREKQRQNSSELS